MRYPATESAAKHQWIVREASRLFREPGFENVTVGQTMKAARQVHGPFCARVDSKLQTAAVVYGPKVSLGRMQQQQQEHKDPTSVWGSEWVSNDKAAIQTFGRVTKQSRWLPRYSHLSPEAAASAYERTVVHPTAKANMH